MESILNTDPSDSETDVEVSSISHTLVRPTEKVVSLKPHAFVTCLIPYQQCQPAGRNTHVGSNRSAGVMSTRSDGVDDGPRVDHVQGVSPCLRLILLR